LNNQAQAATWEHESFMRRCLDLARRAAVSGDIWVGSLIVLKGQIIGEGTERVKAENDLGPMPKSRQLKRHVGNLPVKTWRGAAFTLQRNPASCVPS